MSATLTVYRNTDTARARPCRVRVGAGVDTLAELCRVITRRLAASSSSSSSSRQTHDDDDSSSSRHLRRHTDTRAYCFLYALDGTPLWSVRACVAARRVVASQTAGFAACHATTATRHERRANNDDDDAHDDCASDDVYSRVSNSGGGDGRRGGTSPLPLSPSSHLHAAAYATTAATATRLSIQLTTPLHTTPSSSNSSSSRRSSHSSGKSSSSSTSLSSTSSRSSSGSSGSTTSSAYSRSSSSSSSSDDDDVPDDKAASQTLLYVDDAVLRLPPPARFVATSSPCDDDDGDDDDAQRHRLRMRLQLLLARKWHAAAALRGVPDEQLLGRRAVQRVYAATMSSSALSSTTSRWRVCVSGPAGSGVSTTCAMLMQHVLQRRGNNNNNSDSDDAFASRDGRLHGCLLLPLDMGTLCTRTHTNDNDDDKDDGDATNFDARGNGDAHVSVLDDLLAMLALVVQSTFDAVAAHRPALRAHVPMLVSLWLRLCHLATRRPSSSLSRQRQAGALLFVHNTAAAAAVLGRRVLVAWSRYAQTLLPLLTAYATRRHQNDHNADNADDDSNSSSGRGCAAKPAVAAVMTRVAEEAALRDAVLTEVYCGVPCHIAAALRFAGVVYVLDGVQRLTRVCADRLHRPYGDAGALLRAVWTYGCDTNNNNNNRRQQKTTSSSSHGGCHALVAWPADVPVGGLYLPHTTAHVHTIGLLRRSDDTTSNNNSNNNNDDDNDGGLRLPSRIRFGRSGVEYGVDVFMGAPGYVAALAALVRATAAHAARSRDDYVLRLDNAHDAADALAHLSRLVRAIASS